MFDQLSQLVSQIGQESVVNNNEVPNEQNENVMNEASNSILSGLQNLASEGNIEQLTDLFKGNNSSDSSNPVIQKLTEQLSGNLGEKFGLSKDTSSGIASSLIPKVLGSLVNKAKDPNEESFQITDIIKSISGGNEDSGLMQAISNLGSKIDLDQNNDGKVDLDDAISAVKNKDGIGGIINDIFGK